MVQEAIEPQERDWKEDLQLLLHFTNNWMLFGSTGFVLLCAIVGALKGAVAMKP